jgi:transposase
VKEDTMEQVKNKEKNFRGQRIYVGIDVHKKQWNVSIRNNGLLLKTFSMNPSPEELERYLRKNYPEGEYYSVYEAGYCGFWIHEALEKLGIKNKVVNPADVPTRGKEKVTKTDTVDSRKLARELENGAINGIYVPTKYHQELRSLCRLRERLTTHQARLKNRIKGHLSFYGKPIPLQSELYHWSNRFIQYLRTIEFEYGMGKEYLEYCIGELEYTRKNIAEITKKIRKKLPGELMIYIKHPRNRTYYRSDNLL